MKNPLLGSVLALFFLILIGCQPPPPDPAADLKPTIDAYVEIWNTGNVDALDSLVEASFLRHISPAEPGGPEMNLDQLKQNITEFRGQFPDVAIRSDEEIYADGKAVLRWTFTGTHTGSIPDLPATGKAVSLSGVSVYHFTGSKFTHEWLFADNQDFLQQLGFTVAPPAFEGVTTEEEGQE